VRPRCRRVRNRGFVSFRRKITGAVGQNHRSKITVRNFDFGPDNIPLESRPGEERSLAKQFCVPLIWIAMPKPGCLLLSASRSAVQGRQDYKTGNRGFASLRREITGAATKNHWSKVRVRNFHQSLRQILRVCVVGRRYGESRENVYP
jgi:hypothetical protein